MDGYLLRKFIINDYEVVKVADTDDDFNSALTKLYKYFPYRINNEWIEMTDAMRLKKIKEFMKTEDCK